MSMKVEEDRVRRPMNIIIPTCGRDSLLKRTLESLSKCPLPEELNTIYIVENGAKFEAEDTVNSFEDKLPIKYLYVERPNKSNALNHVLQSIKNGVVVFFDDDVRFTPDTIMAYSRTCNESAHACFWGGPVAIDYEAAPPPQWLNIYLPRSAKGWSLDKGEIPDWFLGANWAVKAEDLHRVGGFDHNYGPGSASGARGQESNMQILLRQSGLSPEYVPDALVYHYVPNERCSPDWVLNRTVQTYKAYGIRDSEKPFIKKLPTFIYSNLSSRANGVLSILFNLAGRSSRSFFYKRVYYKYQGFLSTFKLFYNRR